MAEHRVVVEVELGVGSEKAAVLRDDEGVDLDEGAVMFEKQVVELRHHRRRGPDLVDGDVQRVGDLAGLIRQQAEHGVDGNADDLLRRLLCHLLDVHATRLARHHDDPSGGPVDNHPDVQFALDLKRLLHEYRPDGHALRPGLVRDEVRADQRACGCSRLIGGRYELDAARLAASARVDLRLHNDAPA